MIFRRRNCWMNAGIPLILVGDSLGMVVLGYPDTTRVTMEEILHHVRMVARAKPSALFGADLPFKSYDTVKSAVANAKKLTADRRGICESRRGTGNSAASPRHYRAGVAFCGHLGMLPSMCSRKAATV